MRQTGITATEFRQLAESNSPTELIDGEVVVSPSPKREHQLIVGRLFRLLGDILTEGELLFAPMDLYLDERNVLQPDLFWVSPDSPCQLIDDYWHGAPALVIEISSPSTSLRDRREKFQLYQRYGVQEYWLVEAEGRYIEVWRQHEGRLAQQGLFGFDDILESALLGGQAVAVRAVFGE